MIDSNDTIQLVTIVNGDTNVPHRFEIVMPRFDHLRDLVANNDLPVLTPWGAGVEAGAALGMSQLFCDIPHKFPLQSILDWLRHKIDPTVSTSVIESALIQLARIYA